MMNDRNQPALNPDAIPGSATDIFPYFVPVDGIVTERTEDGIVYTTLHEINEATLKAWGHHIGINRDHWTEDILYGAVEFTTFPLSRMGKVTTTAQNAIKKSKEIKSYTAIIIPNDVVGQIINFTMRTTRILTRIEQYQLLHSRADALRWLRAARTREERKAALKQT